MKKLNLILTGLFASLISFSQPVNYEVYVLKYTSLAHPSATTAPAKDSIHVDFMVWLLKGDNGKNILVDAGFLYGVDEAKDFSGINYLRSDTAVQNITIQPQDITDIIVSHQHVENIDYKDVFPNAHLWIQKDDYNYFTRTSWQKGGQNAEFNKKSVRTLLDMNNAGLITFTDASTQDIFPGIKLYIGAGQNFNPQYLLVKTGSDKLFLTSENIWLYYNLENLSTLPTYGAFSAGSYIQAMQMMKTLVFDVKYIPAGQDASLFSKFPVATEGVIRIK